MGFINYTKNGTKVSIPAFKGDKGEKGDKGDNGTPVVIMTQEQYDAISVPVQNTLYVITEE